MLELAKSVSIAGDALNVDPATAAFHASYASALVDGAEEFAHLACGAEGQAERDGWQLHDGDRDEDIEIEGGDEGAASGVPSWLTAPRMGTLRSTRTTSPRSTPQIRVGGVSLMQPYMYCVLLECPASLYMAPHLMYWNQCRSCSNAHLTKQPLPSGPVDGKGDYAPWLPASPPRSDERSSTSLTKEGIAVLVSDSFHSLRHFRLDQAHRCVLPLGTAIWLRVQPRLLANTRCRCSSCRRSAGCGKRSRMGRGEEDMVSKLRPGDHNPVSSVSWGLCAWSVR
ncbi:hypothetical protein BC834DRAFT_50787 [Gloeopeniophorella convolvens]|nr:hypothetical protein BC834DRAFT_50787 [Gloeopeniophorella convolvens]